MDHQLRFGGAADQSTQDAWCTTTSLLGSVAWDGLDFPPCFRTKFIDGIPALVFLSLSVATILISLLYTFVTYVIARRHRSIPGPNLKRRPSIASMRSSTSASLEIRKSGSSALTEAENEVIFSIVQEQSPDLTPADIRRFGGEDAGASAWVIGLNDEEVEDAELLLTFRRAARALWGTKKDLLGFVTSVGIMSLLVVRLKAQWEMDGARWTILGVAAWSWTTLITLAKLAMSYSSRLYALQNPQQPHRPLPAWYSTLEYHFIPWLAVATFISFFDLRSSILVHYSHRHHSSAPLTLRLNAALFALIFALLTLELVSPRPSRFSSRSSKDLPTPDDGSKPLTPPPELHASLFSLLTFSYLDRWMFGAAFPRISGAPPISMETVPDLRADDKTARVLLSYRRDVTQLHRLLPRTKKSGLTPKLFWHFRGPLFAQQAWSYLRVAVVALPPLFLKGLLAHIGKRSRGEEAPMHIALLYAAAMVLFQIIGSLAASQSLIIGRRICIRLRSIIIGEVFTKALRRKDMAGASAEDDEKTSENQKKTEAETDEELEKASNGKILNLISVDTFRLSEICAYLHFIWPEMLLTIFITLALLFTVLGWSAVAGVVVLIVITPLQAACSRLFYVYQKRLLAAADQRLNLATEVISSVRIVKYFAWEKKFLEMMDATRQKELSALWLRALTMVFGGVLMFGAPVIVSVATFSFHTKVLHLPLTAETAFTALALFNILRGPLEGFVDMLVNVLQAHVSLKRIDEFLAEEETAKYTILREPSSALDPTIGFVGGEFTWSAEEEARADPSVFRIKDLSLNFPVGKLSIILGPVGSGKTTLLLSLLGETNRLSGSSFLPSPVVRASNTDPSILTDTSAYASQSAWLMSDTIRANILFGSALNESRYKAVLEACALNPDLAQFELGDDTEVGEKGTVLSGGQKARIALARAIYSPAKHILLDDVLSAVDSHTAQHLVQKCLTGRLMRHRTCILVTHAVDLCLPVSAFFVSMDQGVVVTSGAPTELSSSDKKLLAVSAEALAEVNSSSFFNLAVPEADLNPEVLAQQAEEKRARQQKLKLIKDETQSEGAVSREVYFMYIRAMGGWSWLAAALVIFIGAQLAEVGVSVALRYWAGSYDDKGESAASLAVASVHHSINRWRQVSPHLVAFARPSAIIENEPNAVHTSDYWLNLYCGLAVINLTLYGARVAFFMYRGIVASRVIYTDLITRILGARIRFFDSTPTGRILNRLSKDMETIDQDVAVCIMYLLLEVLSVIAIIGTISAVLPLFLIAAFFITLTYWAIGVIYLASSRELKRSDSVTKSPIFGVFGEVLNGVSTIRAYGDSTRFAKSLFALIDLNNRPFFALWQGNRWLSVRVDVAGAMVTAAATLFVLASRRMDAALAGFIISFAIAFNERVLWVVRLWSQVEVNANSVERVQEYLELEQEAQGGIVPSAVWPSREGSIEVEGLTATYSPDLPPVLKNVTFKVAPREKIGICGRTGSGKSTLGLSFFRFIEPTSGRIVIDGQDINKLALSELRSRLTIVAQESVLFAGTLRFNLDPFDQFEDSDIWDALRRVQMAPPIGQTPKPTPGPSRAPSPTRRGSQHSSEDDTLAEEAGERAVVIKSLSMVVTEGGKNFSAGQRQLLALARGILKLRTSSILILDESTASLDQATDERIQQTIREEMQDATILCIAHRLRTIVDYDKILVLGAGEVLEFDSPANLLEKEGSVFADLCQKSGEYDELKEIAMAKRAEGKRA